MNHNTLENYYKSLWALVHHYHYSWAELESMIPFELDIIQSMIKDFNDKQAEAATQARLAAEASSRRRA